MIYYIILDILLLGLIGFLAYRYTLAVREKKNKKVVRPNMEVFHEPTLRQNTLKNLEKPLEPIKLDDDCIKMKTDDGNNLLRQLARSKGKPSQDGGSDLTSYTNF